MKRNTYRKNNINPRYNSGETGGDHTTVDKHSNAAGYTVDNQHNRQGLTGASDNMGEVSAAAVASTASDPASSRHPEMPVTLAFSLKQMTDLVIAYESYRKLEQSIMLITGDIPDNPILAGLRHIDEIILDISPVFDDMDEDVEYETFVKVLDDPKMGAEEKAEKLMGL